MQNFGGSRLKKGQPRIVLSFSVPKFLKNPTWKELEKDYK